MLDTLSIFKVSDMFLGVFSHHCYSVCKSWHCTVPLGCIYSEVNSAWEWMSFLIKSAGNLTVLLGALARPCRCSPTLCCFEMTGFFFFFLQSSLELLSNCLQSLSPVGGGDSPQGQARPVQNWGAGGWEGLFWFSLRQGFCAAQHCPPLSAEVLDICYCTQLYFDFWDGKTYVLEVMD
jgi:hypothetical protein